MTKSKGNPLGAGTKNVTVNMPTQMVARIDALAKASGMSRGAYMRQLLKENFDVIYELGKKRIRTRGDLEKGGK